jgi:hypothetical protein
MNRYALVAFFAVLVAFATPAKAQSDCSVVSQVPAHLVRAWMPDENPTPITDPSPYSMLLLVQVCGDVVQLVRTPVTRLRACAIK